MTKYSLSSLLFWLAMALIWGIIAYDSWKQGKDIMLCLQIILCIASFIKGLWGFHREKKE